jgi:hypothetical protein
VTTDEPGQDSGRAPAQPPAGLSWGDLVTSLVEQHGSLAQVARARAIAERLDDDELRARRSCRGLGRV